MKKEEKIDLLLKELEDIKNFLNYIVHSCQTMTPGNVVHQKAQIECSAGARILIINNLINKLKE